MSWGDFGFTPNNKQTPRAARAWPHEPARRPLTSAAGKVWKDLLKRQWLPAARLSPRDRVYRKTRFALSPTERRKCHMCQPWT
jgi:hypothetical protein